MSPGHQESCYRMLFVLSGDDFEEVFSVWLTSDARAKLGSEPLACPASVLRIPVSLVFARSGYRSLFFGRYVLCSIVYFGHPSSRMLSFWLLVFLKADYLSLSCYRLSRYSFFRQSYHSIDKVVQIQFSEVLKQLLCCLCPYFFL